MEDFKETECDCFDWIHVWKEGDFFISWASVSFSRTLLYEISWLHTYE